MQVTTKAGQVGFFSYYYHAVGLVYCFGYGSLVARGKGAQIENIYCSTLAIDHVGRGCASFQNHWAPGDNDELAGTLAKAQAARLANWLSVISFGHIPVGGHSMN